MSELRVGFIGLGNMGGRMTGSLLRGGVDVLGFDAQQANLDASGATVAASGAQVTRESDVVLLSLPNSRIVEAVVLGDDGVLANVREGQVVVDLSTAAPASTRAIAEKLAAKGAHYLDAGISGGAAAAEKGTLTLMVGGDADALARIQPVLAHIATTVVHMGASGSGHVTKLLNNFLNAVALSATAEVMVAGKKAGLDLDALLEVLNASSGVNFATLNRFPKIVHGDYLKGGLTNTLMMKDVQLYTELIADLGVAGLHASGPVAAFGLAIASGRADEISNTVVDAIGDVSGGVRLHLPLPGADAATSPEGGTR
ncbi:NAD(P)-dependent oxidoreductase [Schumannella soli]|uniref:NAD(P)-dependent oxidoreductase n=1 Tax=Schumannella soli TaxID=2590779 RepID=A0A506Y1J6_9MICO|nr:NAD(P)-dependent oxidoreductase [Schumannella soli]TPW74818.1 NAD(P)-dependent oxidoreductase [Schumannella soli]